MQRFGDIVHREIEERQRNVIYLVIFLASAAFVVIAVAMYT